MYTVEKSCFRDKYTNIIPTNADILINGCSFKFHKEIAVKKYDFWNKYFSSQKNNPVDIHGFFGPMSIEVIECAISLMYDDIVLDDIDTQINNIGDFKNFSEKIDFMYDLVYILDEWNYGENYPEILIYFIGKSLNLCNILGSVIKSVLLNCSIKNIKSDNYDLTYMHTDNLSKISFKILNKFFVFDCEIAYNLNIIIKKSYSQKEINELINIIDIFGNLISYNVFAYLYNHKKINFFKNFGDLFDLIFCVSKRKKREYNSFADLNIPSQIEKIMTFANLNKKYFKHVRVI